MRIIMLTSISLKEYIKMKDSLKMTGERVLEDGYRESPVGYCIYLMHLAGYKFAEPWCKDKEILDFGCGSGYGAMKMARVAGSLVGVDVSEEAVNFARARYGAENLKFQEISENRPLPFPDNHFDVVLSSQVLEHVYRDEMYLSEARRVLKENGIFIIITPDRSGRLFPWQKPWNRWHLREYSAERLKTLVGRFFRIEHALKMGAPWELANIEYNRYRKLKWLTLPFTLSFMPERWRIAGLNFLHGLNGVTAGRHKSEPFDPENFPFNEESFGIDVEVENPLNLLVVGRK